LPRDVEPAPIVAFGIYEGARKIGLRIGEADNATSLVSVSGSRSGENRILLLMAYEATIWDFSEAPTNRINAVIVSGYYDQAVANLPDTVPVIFADRERHVCGQPRYAYRGGHELEHAANAIERSTGQELASFNGIYSAHTIVLSDVLQHSARDTAVRAGEIRAAVRVTQDDTPQGDEGLATLEARGIIRRATAEDVARWNRAATQRLRTGRLASYESEYLMVSRTYVVLAPMTTPAGMYGAHSRSFILMPGVPTPEDRGSHNTYYRIEDGTCSGTAPDC
jgi:hypothetical protein